MFASTPSVKRDNAISEATNIITAVDNNNNNNNISDNNKNSSVDDDINSSKIGNRM